jgi:ubiquinone/menaquinone biosynthesis C-methylase UbiE
MKVQDILIAGCGTGAHSIETAQRFPDAQVLAIDISRTSLAYARRKTREAGVQNVQYAQADVLKLDTIGRRFDLIEVVGVLHHLSDPAEGWRVLLSILRPGGLMLVGVFSALGERTINADRTFIQERGYGPTADDIRAGRQELIHHSQAMASTDFYSTSGCRALWFNAVEHQFTIPDIGALIDADGLSFLGFEVRPDIREQFTREFPEPGAFTDLNCWQAFEQAHPSTFTGMYVFWVQKNDGPEDKK